MYAVKFAPTNEYGAAEVTAATSAWYFGSIGSQPMPTPEEAVEVAQNAIEMQSEHRTEIGKYYTLVAVEMEPAEA